MLERLAAITGDGRYRFGAQKLFNYLRYQHRGPKNQSNDTGALWFIALASIWADDRVESDRTERRLIMDQAGRSNPNPSYGQATHGQTTWQC